MYKKLRLNIEWEMFGWASAKQMYINELGWAASLRACFRATNCADNFIAVRFENVHILYLKLETEMV